MKEPIYAAADIGATGIKLVAGAFTGERLLIKDTCFAENPPVMTDGGECADIDRMLAVIKSGLGRFGSSFRCISLGIDTYGNGYGVLDAQGKLIRQPHHYRDRRVDGIVEKVQEHYTDWQLYQLTGNFPVKTRGLFHLWQDVLEGSANIALGQCFLPLPNLLEYLLTGERGAERTIASVLYLLNQKGEDWNLPVFEKLGIPRRLFGPLSEAGSCRGKITKSFAAAAPIAKTAVVSVVGHDTESALLAAPGLTGNQVFVSLGTSFIFGTRVTAPVINEDTYQSRFKNIRGAFGSYSLCKDFPGFWILERCLERWRKTAPDLSYEGVCQAAQEAGKSTAFIHVGDDRFRVSTPDVEQLIHDYCRQTNQNPVAGIGGISRCLFESYALYLRWNLERLEAITGTRYDELVAVGGGVRNHVLLQLFADVLGIPVIAGSPYASAAGNLLMQIYAAGEAGTPSQLNEIAANSWAPQIYEGRETAYWTERLEHLKQKGIFREEAPCGHT